MNKKLEHSKFDKIKQLLEEEETFPMEYNFKFIVPVAKLSEILSFFPNEKRVATKPSSKGTYISVTVNKVVLNAEEVIQIYESVSVIDGLISL